MHVHMSRVAPLLLLCSAAAHAQTGPITEADLLARLSPDNPLVQAARAGVAVTRAEALAAGRWPNPRATFNRESVAGVAENVLLVAQPLPISGRRHLEMSAAASRVDASASRADDRVRRLRADLRAAYAAVRAAGRRERELAANRDRLEGVAGVIARREAAGDAAGFDRLRAEREVLDVETARAAAAMERARASITLGAFAAGTLPAAFDVADTGAARTPLPAIDELLARAEQSRGELIAWRHELESAEFAVRAANRLAIPEPEVVAGTKSSNANGGDVGAVVSVHVNVPVFDRGQPERAAAHARAGQARAEADAFRRWLRAEITAWRDAVEQRRAIADRYREASTGAGEIERVARVSYDAGEGGILELLDAYRIGAAARLRQIELEAAVREAEIELEFASGWELP